MEARPKCQDKDQNQDQKDKTSPRLQFAILRDQKSVGTTVNGDLKHLFLRAVEVQ